MKQRLSLMVLMAVLLALAACSPSTVAPAELPAPAISTAENTPVPTTAPVAGSTEAVVSVSPTEAAASEPTAAPPAADPSLGPPPNRGAALEATDPSTFTLASGQPQFVEFFAFW